MRGAPILAVTGLQVRAEDGAGKERWEVGDGDWLSPLARLADGAAWLSPCRPCDRMSAVSSRPPLPHHLVPRRRGRAGRTSGWRETDRQRERESLRRHPTPSPATANPLSHIAAPPSPLGTTATEPGPEPGPKRPSSASTLPLTNTHEAAHPGYRPLPGPCGVCFQFANIYILFLLPLTVPTVPVWWW